MPVAVERRKEFFGANVLPTERPPSSLLLLLKQFKSPLIFILVIAGFVTLFLHQYTDSTVIFGTVLINTIIGYIQESRATNALSQLKKILKHKGTVIRAKQEMEISQSAIVPGDLIVLKPGDKVPADGRIIESWNLQINEAVLTGEWISSTKLNTALEKQTPLADRDNMIYMGSVVESGNGKAIVTATGMQTEIGKIGMLLKKTKDVQTPYQQKLSRFAWLIGLVVGTLALFIFLQGILSGGTILEMFEIAVAIAVSAIPEGLPIAMTIVLAIGMQRILRKKGLVRSLPAAETLGSTSVIATDKTLTLTEGKMQVEEITPLRLADREQVLVAATLANEAYIENPEAVLEKWIVRGRPTDRALITAAMDAGISKIELEKILPLLLRIPFDSKSKYVASLHKTEDNLKLYISGAPENILALSLLSEDERVQAEAKLNELTQKGLRVVCTGFKEIAQDDIKDIPKEHLTEHLKKQLVDVHFLGFIALKDPIRKGIHEAINITKEAGVKTIIATGDHALTAAAVAKELGLPSEPRNVIEGKQLDALSDKELQELLPQISVYARVEPIHKVRIIEAWQNQNAVIAMTGDGVNDAPALKKANIGIALGSGTAVAKEASDLILLTDNFSIIPAAIKEGRVIFDNIRKIITYMLAGSFTETLLIGAALLFGAPFLPVTALQILWINLVEGTLPSVALTLEKAEKDVMRRKPPKPSTSLLTGEMKAIIFVISTVTDFFLIGLFYWLLQTGSYAMEHIQTIIFVGLGIDSLFYVFSCRSLRKNIWEYNPFSNLFLVGSVLLGFAMLFAVIYIPILQTLFRTQPLGLTDWGLLAGLGILNVVLIEAGKWYFIRRDRKRALSTEL